MMTCGAGAQVAITLDEFTSNSNYYNGFNFGSGTVSSAINQSDFSSGSSSLQLNYSFNAGSGTFFTSLRNYGTNLQDYSHLTTGFSLEHKGGNTSDQLSIRLWEDIDGNGTFDGTDEVFESTASGLGSAGWTTTHFNLSSFKKIAGNGNSQIDLNRIRAWDLKISSSISTPKTGVTLLDHLQLHSSYTPPLSGKGKLNGSFIQLWNTTGCKCGEWQQDRWETEMQKMKAAELDYLVVQYSVYHDLSWYTPSAIPSVIFEMPTLNRMMAAAEKVNLKIHFGLYFDETWNSANKASANTYSSILQKHKTVADELWNLFGNSPSFGGWYIPQELNDLEWQDTPEKTLLFNFIKDITDYTESLSVNHPIMIAPFFNLWQPADQVEVWYNQLLATATHLNRVYPQDGVGITLKSPDYHLPLYFSAIKRACENHNKKFGATLESFHQTSGWPVDNGTFSATSTDMNTLKRQLWAAEEQQAFELIQFSWSYMQPQLTPESEELYQDYLIYLNDLAVATKAGPTAPHSMRVFPNPTDGKVIIDVDPKYKCARIYSTEGVLMLTTELSEFDVHSLKSGLYVLEIELENRLVQTKLIKN